MKEGKRMGGKGMEGASLSDGDLKESLGTTGLSVDINDVSTEIYSD